MTCYDLTQEKALLGPEVYVSASSKTLQTSELFGHFRNLLMRF